MINYGLWSLLSGLTCPNRTLLLNPLKFGTKTLVVYLIIVRHDSGIIIPGSAINSDLSASPAFVKNNIKNTCFPIKNKVILKIGNQDSVNITIIQFLLLTYLFLLILDCVILAVSPLIIHLNILQYVNSSINFQT